MAKDFYIPKLGEGIKEATIVQWLVDDGAQVDKGEEILEVETDKASLPVEANAAGHIHLGPYEQGDTVPILKPIATIGEEGGSFEPSAERVDEEDEEADAGEESARPPAETGQSEEAAEPAEDGPRATPVARKMARELGVELSGVNGSGVQGKVTKADVQRAASGEEEAAPADPTPAPKADKPKTKAAPQPAEKPAVQPAANAPDTPEEEVLERIPLKGIKGVIARRMAESVHTTARVTLVTEVDATEFVALRSQLKAQYSEAWGFSPGYNDLLAMIVANALREFPYMNARLAADGQAIEQVKSINMGMAVDTERGLMVPVIKQADRLGLRELGSSFRELVQRAREGKSSLDDLSGNTFTITSLGIFRVDAFTPVINLPDLAILGVGRIKARPVVKDEEIVSRQIMTLSLVFDHRLVDGAPAARFLDHICELIEEPALWFLTKR